MRACRGGHRSQSRFRLFSPLTPFLPPFLPQLQYDLAPELFVDDLEAFLDEESASGVWVFINTFDHFKVVEACAARGARASLSKAFGNRQSECHPYEGASPNA